MFEIDSDLKHEYRFTLLKPDQTPIGELFDISDVVYTGNFPTTDELTFTIPRYVKSYGKKVEHPLWDEIRGDYLVHMQALSGESQISEKIFIIVNFERHQGDMGLTKNISAYSLEYELNNRLLRDYNFLSRSVYSEMNQRDSDGFEIGVLNHLETRTRWKVGYVSPNLLTKRRAFSVSEQTFLNFITSELQPTFNCICLFDTIEREINIYSIEAGDIDTNQDLYISDKNYIENIVSRQEHEDIITRLFVFGQNNLSFQQLNPTGQPFVDNLEYYKTEEYMSAELIQALNSYEDKVSLAEPAFSALLEDLNTYQTTRSGLLAQRGDAQIELNLIHSEIDIRIASNLDYDDLLAPAENEHTVIYWKDEINSINSEIAIQDENITNNRIETERLKNHIARGKLDITIEGDFSTVDLEDYFQQNSDIKEITYIQSYDGENWSFVSESDYTFDNNIITFTTSHTRLRIGLMVNFTESQLTELDFFIREGTWSDSNYENAQDLWDAVPEIFGKINQPPITFDLDLIDFLSIVECQKDWPKLRLGDIVALHIEEQDIYFEPRLVQYVHDISNHTLSLTFSNKNSIDDPEHFLNDVISQAYSSSRTVDMSKFKWNKSEENSTKVNQILNNAWDAARQRVTGGQGQSVITDERGILLRQLDPNITPEPGVEYPEESYSEEQLRMVNNAIAFTSNRWQSANLAITPGKIYAEHLYGNVLATNQAYIETSNGDFIVNQDGAVIQDLDLSITRTSNGQVVNKIIMNAQDGIKIQDSDNNDVFYADAEGHLNLTGQITVEGGVVTDSSIQGGTIAIGSGNSIFKASTTGIWLGHTDYASAPFKVDIVGNLYANSAEFEQSTFEDGDIIGSSITIGEANNVFKANTSGMWLGNDSFANAPFKVGMDGNFKVGDSSQYVEWNGSGLSISGNINMTNGTIVWNNVTGPGYSDITGTKPPTSADNTETKLLENINFTKIGAGFIYTGEIIANQITGNEFTALDWMAIGDQDSVGDRYLYFNKGSRFNNECYIVANIVNPSAPYPVSDLVLKGGYDVVAQAKHTIRLEAQTLDLSGINTIYWGSIGAPVAVFG